MRYERAAHHHGLAERQRHVQRERVLVEPEPRGREELVAEGGAPAGEHLRGERTAALAAVGRHALRAEVHLAVVRALQVAEEYLVGGQAARDMLDGDDVSHHAGLGHGPRSLGLNPAPETEHRGGGHGPHAALHVHRGPHRQAGREPQQPLEYLGYGYGEVHVVHGVEDEPHEGVRQRQGEGRHGQLGPVDVDAQHEVEVLARLLHGGTPYDGSLGGYLHDGVSL